MTRLTFLAGKRGTQLATLRRYLLSHGVSQKLMLRIQRNAQHALEMRQQKMTEAQVELIAIISEPLRVELHFEEHGPKLCEHPFFQFYQDVCPAAMQKICHSAISEKIFYHGDIIFSVGEVPSNPQMYFISSGSLCYQQSRSTEIVSDGMWLSEGVLWVRWMHRGILRAKKESRVLCLSASSFQDITLGFESPVFHPSQYGLEFVEHLKSKAGEEPLTDLGTKDGTEEILEEVFASHEAEQNCRMNARQTRSGKGVSVRFSTAFSRMGSGSTLGGFRQTISSSSTIGIFRRTGSQDNDGSMRSNGASIASNGSSFFSKWTGQRQRTMSRIARTSVHPTMGPLAEEVHSGSSDAIE